MDSTALNDSAILVNVTWTLDGTEIHQEDVVQANIHWSRDVFGVSGTVNLKDNADGSNLFPLNSENELQVYSEDRFNDHYFKTFVFANIQEAKMNKRIKVHQYNLIDRLTYKMMNTYISKSYSGVLLSDIIADFFGAYAWSELVDVGVVLELLPTEVLHEHIIVPQHISFLEFIKDALMKEGCTMYQTKKSIRIGVKKDDVSPANLEMIAYDSFSQYHMLTEHPFRIHEHQSTFNPDLTQNMESPLQQSTVFNFKNKMTMPILKTAFTMQDVFGDFQLGTSGMANIQKQIGEKLSVVLNNAGGLKKSQAQDAVQKSNMLSIVVVGNFLYNDIYKNADIKLSGSMESKQGQVEGDVRMSGTYTIVGLSDLYLNGKLIQKLDLQRANFMEV